MTGTLHAMMLDQKRALDGIVRARARRDPGARDRIFANPIYRQISSTLTGSHEYAAMAKLYALAAEDRYDLIVLDTPPTANALDFLDSPEKLADAIDSPAVQWLIKPYLESGHFSIKLVGAWAAPHPQAHGQVRGLALPRGHGAVRVRVQHRARRLSRARARGVPAPAAPERELRPGVLARPAIDEALAFHARLAHAGLGLGGFVINRVHPRGPQGPGRGELVELLEAREELRGFQPDDYVQAASDLDRTYADFQALAAIDATQVTRVAAAVAAPEGAAASASR